MMKDIVIKGYVTKTIITTLEGEDCGEPKALYRFIEEDNKSVLGSSGFLNEVFIGFNKSRIRKDLQKVFETNYKRKCKVSKERNSDLVVITLGGKL